MKHYVNRLNVGNVTGVLSLILSIYMLFKQYSTVTTVVLGIYGLIFITWFIFREYVFARKARFAEAATPITLCYTHIKLAHEAIDEGSQQLAYDKIRCCLESFATAFSLITGVHCRACIKNVTIDETRVPQDEQGTPHFDDAYVTKTFCRGSNSTSDTNEQWVPIAENTDFELLTKEKHRRFWLSNDISSEHNYKNSSIRDKYGAEWKDFF